MHNVDSLSVSIHYSLVWPKTIHVKSTQRSINPPWCVSRYNQGRDASSHVNTWGQISGTRSQWDWKYSICQCVYPTASGLWNLNEISRCASAWIRPHRLQADMQGRIYSWGLATLKPHGIHFLYLLAIYCQEVRLREVLPHSAELSFLFLFLRLCTKSLRKNKALEKKTLHGGW